MNYELRLSAVHSLSDNIDQHIKFAVRVGNGIFSTFLSLRKLGQSVINPGKLLIETLVLFSPMPALASSCSDHELGDSFEPRETNIVLLIIHSNLRQCIYDKFDLAF